MQHVMQRPRLPGRRLRPARRRHLRRPSRPRRQLPRRARHRANERGEATTEDLRHSLRPLPRAVRGAPRPRRGRRADQPGRDSGRRPGRTPTGTSRRSGKGRRAPDRTRRVKPWPGSVPGHGDASLEQAAVAGRVGPGVKATAVTDAPARPPTSAPAASSGSPSPFAAADRRRSAAGTTGPSAAAVIRRARVDPRALVAVDAEPRGACGGCLARTHVCLATPCHTRIRAASAVGRCRKVVVTRLPITRCQCQTLRRYRSRIRRSCRSTTSGARSALAVDVVVVVLVVLGAGSGAGLSRRALQARPSGRTRTRVGTADMYAFEDPPGPCRLPTGPQSRRQVVSGWDGYPGEELANFVRIDT